MTATDSPLDEVLLAVALLAQHGEKATPAAVQTMLPLGTNWMHARLALIEAQLLHLIDEDGLTAAGLSRVNECPARRSLLSLLAAPADADLELVA
ncbi:hypothetical protein C8N24_0305 [Solirubrobacter pauli]|uniref:Uncharacterized protein n=1 Tax=Solirubrobacter pauli TaxID=166793 RepID=A0A660L984_9ACTN|nr:hypothetical protein [Solirubrobacter pauli]RKQ90500.1 hypothetical protein C8N24_0305 [Solirubrobacter pauli]